MSSEIPKPSLDVTPALDSADPASVDLEAPGLASAGPVNLEASAGDTTTDQGKDFPTSLCSN